MRDQTMINLISLRPLGEFYGSHCPEINTRWIRDKGNVQIRLRSQRHPLRDSVMPA